MAEQLDLSTLERLISSSSDDMLQSMYKDYTQRLDKISDELKKRGVTGAWSKLPIGLQKVN